MGLLSSLQISHLPYGGPLSKSVLRAMGALDRHHKSTKVPLYVWQLITCYRRLWTSFISPSADAVSAFASLCLIAVGVMRPGFGTGLLVRSVERMPSAFRLPAVLIRWSGHTKSRAERLPLSQGGPGESKVPVVTCVAHDLFRVVLFPFLEAVRNSDRPPDFPFLSRCRRAPDSLLLSAHKRHLFTWRSVLWEATSSAWSLASLTRFARDILTRAGFPDALPFASAIHACRVASNSELQKLLFEPSLRDTIGQWAVKDQAMRSHYESAAIERMAYATACLGRLTLGPVASGSLSIGFPADVDHERALPYIRSLGPVSVDDEPGSWIPGLVARLSSGAPPVPPPPPLPPLVGTVAAYEDDDADERDADDEQQAIWDASVPPVLPSAPLDAASLQALGEAISAASLSSLAEFAW
jgi:hypothetical protein